MESLVLPTKRGPYCAAGDFYVDPWGKVDRAVITHAHTDHARAGSRQYLAAEPGVAILRERLGQDAGVRGIRYGEAVEINGVYVSLHPAGHVLGSAQVRVEHKGRVTVVTGDYKRVRTRDEDPTCEPYQPLRCHVFITESTFGLPIYRWEPAGQIFAEINAWWRRNQEHERTSVIFGYALGKTQRVLAGVDASIGPIIAHGAVARYLDAYRAAGVRLPQVLSAAEYGSSGRRAELKDPARRKPLVIAPPSASGSPWLRKFGDISTAFASGWMRIRGMKRRRNFDRGFVLSDHADWSALNQTIQATGAEKVYVTHGYTEQMVRYLREQGIDAHKFPTRYEGELETETGEDESSE